LAKRFAKRGRKGPGLTLPHAAVPLPRRERDDSSPSLGYHRHVAEEHAQPLEAQLEEIGIRLAWVRDYL
jgi:hypothetical protein